MSINVASWADLNDMRNDLTEDYLLTVDLDSSSTGYAGVGDDWVPIGESGPGIDFTGTFNGQGHTISDLVVNKPGTDFVGLFGLINSTVENVGLVDVNINGNEWVGGVVGASANSSIVRNCYSTGSVAGNDNVGGVVGGIQFAFITNCYSTASVTGNTGVGGLVGFLFNFTVTNCYAVGSVTGTASVGGLVGVINVAGTVTNCGWYTGAGGNPANAIGTPTGPVTYQEADQTVFYDKTHDVYDSNAPLWQFIPSWLDQAADFPVLVDATQSTEDPTEPTLTVVDKEDGSGATATIAGGDAGATHEVFTAQFDGDTGALGAWTSQGDRVGNGDVDLPVANGYHMAYVKATP